MEGVAMGAAAAVVKAAVAKVRVAAATVMGAVAKVGEELGVGVKVVG